MKAEPTNFLYPFIDGEESDEGHLLTDLARSARGKTVEHHRLRSSCLHSHDELLISAACAIADAVRAGGRIYAFGNGGSATDAAALAELFAERSIGRPLPAMSLVADDAVLTALGNDIGFDVVFARQLIAYARPGDVAVGFSTSGNSENLLCAFAEAKRRALLTVGFAGYDGGAMGRCAQLDYCFTAHSQSIHRIQEAQDALVLALHTAVQRRLSGRPT